MHNNPPDPRECLRLSKRINKTRYSTKRVPEDRRLTKFNQAANLYESSASESTDETYDSYPESDHSAAYGEERLSRLV